MQGYFLLEICIRVSSCFHAFMMRLDQPVYLMNFEPFPLIIFSRKCSRQCWMLKKLLSRVCGFLNEDVALACNCQTLLIYSSGNQAHWQTDAGWTRHRNVGWYAAFANKDMNSWNECEQTVDHILLRCASTGILWQLNFSLFGIDCVILSSIIPMFLSWNQCFKRQKVVLRCFPQMR